MLLTPPGPRCVLRGGAGGGGAGGGGGGENNNCVFACPTCTSNSLNKFVWIMSCSLGCDSITNGWTLLTLSFLVLGYGVMIIVLFEECGGSVVVCLT